MIDNGSFLPALMESYYKCSSEALVVTDSDMKVIVWTPASEKLFGYQKEEVLGKDALLLIAPADKYNTYLSFMKDYIENRKKYPEVLSLSTLYLTKTGEKIITKVNINSFEIDGKVYVSGVLVLANEGSVLLDRFENIIEGTNVGTWEWNVQTGAVIFNEKWAEILGYSLKELMPVDINTWVKLCHPEDLKESDRLLRRHFLGADAYYEFECRMLHKEGYWVWVQDRGKVISWSEDGKPLLMFGTHQDITSRKKEAEINQARVHLLEFSYSHTLHELLEESLNVIERLTGSSIGFYHFIAEDQKTIIFQNWSTNTHRIFCKAETPGTHYSIDQAGVWADCVREGRPVVHNDYAALANKKGMPAGHAKVSREIVVPVYRNGVIKAIFGTGNKESDYTQSDIDTMVLLADLSWDIVDRKLAEESLKIKKSSLWSFSKISAALSLSTEWIKTAETSSLKI